MGTLGIASTNISETRAISLSAVKNGKAQQNSVQFSFRLIFKGKAGLTVLHLEDGTERLPETSVTNYQSSLPSISEERRPRVFNFWFKRTGMLLIW